MKSQTAQRPENQRPARSAKSRKYVKQTAHVEARRDGKPLIFGWGAHLSRNEKNKIQRRAVWTLTTLVAVLIVAVIVGFWVNLNVIIPGEPITSVNGQNVPQSDYRKLVVVKAQLQTNDLQGPHGLLIQRDNLGKQVTQLQATISKTQKQVDNLTTQIKTATGDQLTTLKTQLATAKSQLTDEQNQLTPINTQYQLMQQTTVPVAQSLLNQSQVGNDSITWLQDDLLIRDWLNKQNSTIQTKVEPTTQAINKALSDFKANLPKSTVYSQFLSSNSISESDLQTMLTLKVRRDNMQSYLSSQITSPAYQVLASGITVQNLADAQSVLKQLKGGASFAKIAESKSLDTTTKTYGGDLGWMAQGMYFEKYASKISTVVDNWIFDRSRTLGQISPPLNENGTYHIIQIRNVDPLHEVAQSDLQSLQTDALLLWSYQQKATPSTSATAADSTKLLDPSNMPTWLPSSPPTQPGTNGAGGAAPGGAVPGGTSGLPSGS
jgi:parvulin-like peptidyl-prolyl isomerase